jgi:hypothetical protein
MPDLNTPYAAANPGDLITAELWNEMQRQIRRDIRDTTQAEVQKITRVQSAGNADKLEGKSLSDLTDEVVRRAVAEIRTQSGYLQVFAVLRVGEPKEIQHNFHLDPLVDVYKLDYFPVLCSEDGQTSPMWVNFFLYHASEKRLRNPDTATPGFPRHFDIEPQRGRPFRVPFRELLSRYRIDYDDDSSVSDVETELWDRLFSPPNDRFHDDQYGHSPWFDRCCREEKRIGDLKRHDDLNELWVQFRPRKTINYPVATTEATPAPPAPVNVQVEHYDFDTTGVTLLTPVPAATARWTDQPIPTNGEDGNTSDELKVMILLKV